MTHSSVLLMCAVGVVGGSLPQWPNSFFASFVHEGKNLDSGEPVPPTATLRWYNWDLKKMKDHEIFADGTARTTLFLGTPAGFSDVYFYNENDKSCQKSFAPVLIIAPTWMVDGTAVDFETYDGSPTMKWEKQDHFLWQAEDNSQPKGVYAPINQNGQDIQYHYAQFSATETTDRDFALPSYCSNAKVAEELNSTEFATKFGVAITPWGLL